MLLTLLSLLAAMAPARAERQGDDDPPPTCLGDVTASFYATRSTLTLGQNTTLHWNVRANGCAGVTQAIGSASVPPIASRVETPTSSRTWTLKVRQGGATRTWTVPVTVNLPKDAAGRINVTITANDQAGLFVQAIASAESTNATVYIENNVSLNLSNYADIHIYPGVQIFGGRSPSSPGPLLFTSTYPSRLFVIGEYLDADNVRIHGIRLRGADPSVAAEGAPPSTGISIHSSLNVEVDNNDISGWHIAAIRVHDPRRRLHRLNGRGAVRIRENFLHHNQRLGEGYGVEVSAGAYALVEKNVFDHNRHAIAASGQYETGYFFHRNHVGNTGGHHSSAGIMMHTHQIDVHGTEPNLGIPNYGGVAGECFDVQHNGILYTDGTAIKVRGTPTRRMDVAYNSFRHSDVWGTTWAGFLDYGAMDQTDGEGGINQWGNTFGARGITSAAGVCDFDGDGANDTFSANGATWMYASGAAANGYRYLNTSTLHADQLGFDDIDGNGRCDVRVLADGRVSRDGRAPLERLARTDLLTRNPVTGQLRISQQSGGVITGEALWPVSPDRDVVGAGDFDGDGDSDILVRRRDVVPWPNGEGEGRPTSVLFVQDGAVVSADLSGFSPVGGGVEGIADFDGDGQSDVLWRDEYGALKLWYWGVSTNVRVSWRNLEAPIGLDWDIEAVGDFNGDGYADIAWRDRDGHMNVWNMVGSIFTGQVLPGAPSPLTSTVQGVGDFNGDGRSDLLWRHADGGVTIWFSGYAYGAVNPTWRNLGTPTGLASQIEGVSDFNGDGLSDILWRNAAGLRSVWLMDGGTYVGELPTFTVDNAWQSQGLLPLW